MPGRRKFGSKRCVRFERKSLEMLHGLLCMLGTYGTKRLERGFRPPPPRPIKEEMFPIICTSLSSDFLRWDLSKSRDGTGRDQKDITCKGRSENQKERGTGRKTIFESTGRKTIFEMVSVQQSTKYTKIQNKM